jgi:hypothetical protein
MPNRFWLVPLLLTLGVLLINIASLDDDATDGTLATAQITGRPLMVFDWTRSPCEAIVTPDAPARALRDDQGRTQLILSRYVNARLIGSDLLNLKPRCEPILTSQLNPDPAQFADKEWITSIYTADGRTIYALVHNEYHGWEHPGMCEQQAHTVIKECWYNAINLALSRDGGRTFSSPHAGRRLVASIPYRYIPGMGPAGIFQPSNIVRRSTDDYFYALVRAEDYKAQESGTCVMRTLRLSDAASWRAWDGDAFTVRFLDPYRESGDPARHVCQPVSPHQISGMTDSLTYNTYYRKYLLVGSAGKQDRGGRIVWGVYFSLSGDLINWTERRLIAETELPDTFRCGDRNPILHPSVLDPDSASRNYATSDRHAYLFYTRLNYEDCKPSADLDLVRVPIEFSK